MPEPSAVFTALPVATTVEIVAADTPAEIERVIHEAVTRRAHQLFEESGRIAGRDEENWRQAESETLRNGLEVRDNGTWLSLAGEISTSFESVVIMVSPRRVIIHPRLQDVFFTADAGVDVEPATAIASLKDGRLKVMVKKSNANSHRV